MSVEIDFCEYSSDALAQAAYVSNSQGLQSFSTYTEVDVGTDITIAQHKITAVNYDATDASYVYKDFGVGSLDAIKIKCETQIESSSVAGTTGGISLSTSIGEVATVSTDVFAYLNKEAGGYRAVLIRGNFVSYDVTDYVLSAGTPYYFLLERAAGNGTCTLKIYDDSAMTNLLDTLTITGLGTTKYRYLYGLNHFSQAASYYWTGYVQNLDLYGVSVFSEGTIKTQGTYSLKGVAAKTDSLNDTLTRTISSPIDLSNQDLIKMDIRASRTGSNIQARFRNEKVDQSNTISNDVIWVGNPSGFQDQAGQSFILSGASTVSAVEIKRNAYTYGTPTGTTWTIRIETSSSDLPSGTLANANASVVVTIPAEGAVVKGSFATPFALSASTTYWIVVSCDAQSEGNAWTVANNNTSVYADGHSAYSEDGSWVTYADYDMYFKVFIEEYIEHTANIASADTFQTESIDISGVANASKDNIDRVQFKITNADA